jgi:hypothetical protein
MVVDAGERGDAEEPPWLPRALVHCGLSAPFDRLRTRPAGAPVVYRPIQ